MLIIDRNQEGVQRPIPRQKKTILVMARISLYDDFPICRLRTVKHDTGMEERRKVAVRDSRGPSVDNRDCLIAYISTGPQRVNS